MYSELGSCDLFAGRTVKEEFGSFWEPDIGSTMMAMRRWLARNFVDDFANEKSLVGSTSEPESQDQEGNIGENSGISLELTLFHETKTTDEICSSSDKKGREPIFYDFLATLQNDHVRFGRPEGLVTRKEHESEEISLELKLGPASRITRKRKSSENSSKLLCSSAACGIKRLKQSRPDVREAERHNGRDPWVIKKTITTSDIGHLARLLLVADSVKKHIFPLWDAERIDQIKNGVGVSVWDCDTESEHQLLFKQWPSGSYVLIGNWTTEFVKRRGLNKGDEVGLYWDQSNSRLNFSILKRALLINPHLL